MLLFRHPADDTTAEGEQVAGDGLAVSIAPPIGIAVPCELEGFVDMAIVGDAKS